MKSHCTNYLLAIASVVCLSFAATAQAEDAGYVPPRFMSAGNAGSPGMQRQASPLAGGPAAAYGDQFMDAQGNPIIMPASYCQSCPGPAGGYCPSCPGDFGAAGGYGDPMAVDFGGYGNDQCGPHYFDIAVDSIFLKPNEALDGVGPLISVGAGQNFIDPASGTAEYEPGWRIAARYDLGPLSVFEGTYMGLYDIGFTNQIRSVDATVAAGLPSQDFQLFTVFSNFGIPTPIDGLDDGSVYTLGYQSDIQSTELSYRRYWTGFNTRVTGTLLLGARYLRMTEDFTFNAVAFAGDSSLLTTSENDLVGFQFGGDGWLCLRQGLRIGAEAKAGVYNNRYKLGKTANFAEVGNAPDDFAVVTEGNQVAFAAESGVTMVADILPSWSIRGGYQVLYLNSLATVASSIDPTNIGSTAISTQGDALYHGFHGGLEYIW
ncbi:MAG: hypothetical protein KDA57_14180 [Planctomycetales bacterium]|nr:hypothetical protein [Planctomycetales bacterium]